MIKWKKADRLARGGFTFIEILVVVLIIAMLAAFMAPRLFKKLGKAKRDLAGPKMSIVESGLEEFALDCERYPTEAEGLDALLEEPPDMEEDKWDGPYVKASALLDPWNNRYEYVRDGVEGQKEYDLICFGADGEVGGDGDNEDIHIE